MMNHPLLLTRVMPVKSPRSFRGFHQKPYQIRPARISSRLVIQKGIRTEGKRLAGKVFR